MKFVLKDIIGNDSAVASIEAGLLFPVLAMVMCGMVDIGVGMITNIKVTNSTQIVADLVSRGTQVTQAEIDDAIIAGSLALQPYNTDSYGVDIAGIEFVDEDLDPTVQWRETVNMEPNVNITEHSEGLGLEGEGVIGVTVRYVYEPFFTGFVLSTIVMEEESIARGRRGVFVERVES